MPNRKSYKRVARTHAIRADRWPLDQKSIRVTTQPVRLDRKVNANKTGLGNPWR